MTINSDYFTEEQLSEGNLLKIARFLKEGKLIVFPTETVYGLGADAFNQEAIDQIYQLKEDLRPSL